MGLITKNTKFDRAEFIYFMPTQIKFGAGKIENLANELQLEDDLADKTSVMIFTDKAISAAGLLDKVKTGLANSAYEIKAIFDDIPSDSDVNLINQAARLAGEVEANLFIALGGGSVMDTAKAVAIVAAHGGSIKDYEGLFMVPGRIAPIVTIPTTCGTGSEVSAVLVVKDNLEQRKISIGSYYIFPRLAVLDPNILATLPARLLAYTGFDALTHAIEAYVSLEQEPIAEALALRAVEMIADNLEAAVKDSTNEDARTKMLIASCLAGMAFTNVGVGAVHAIAHAFGGVFGTHHGLSNGIILPSVMEFNLAACPERFASLAKALGAFELKLSDEELGRAAIQRVRELQISVGIPHSFAELGITTDEATIEQLAELAINDLSLPFNPRSVELADIQKLIRQALGLEANSASLFIE